MHYLLFYAQSVLIYDAVIYLHSCFAHNEDTC